MHAGMCRCAHMYRQALVLKEFFFSGPIEFLLVTTYSQIKADSRMASICSTVAHDSLEVDLRCRNQSHFCSPHSY